MSIRLSHEGVTAWRLARQNLLDRAARGKMLEVVSNICGAQAQVMSGAAMAIWARVDGVTAQDVEEALWKRRRLVKTWCMRGTLHLLVADELPLYVAALKTRTNHRTKPWLKGHKVTLEEIDKITSEARNSLDGRIMTREELVNDIVERAGFGPSVKQGMLSGWGSLLHPAAYQGNLCFGPSRGKNVTFVRPDQWLGKWNEPNSDRALRTLITRFVAAYGPCTREDFGHWWGLLERKALRIFKEVTEGLQEVEFEGRKAYVRKEDIGQITAQKQTESLRLVPSFDPYVMFYSPRDLLVGALHKPRVFRQLAGWNSPVLLIEGIATGIWGYRKMSSRLLVNVQPFRLLTFHERQLVDDEAAKLGEFFGTESEVSYAT